MKFQCAADGQKGWNTIEASSKREAATKFEQQTGLKAVWIQPVRSGWGNSGLGRSGWGS